MTHTTPEELRAIIVEVEREEGNAAYMFGDSMGVLIPKCSKTDQPAVSAITPAASDARLAREVCTKRAGAGVTTQASRRQPQR